MTDFADQGKQAQDETIDRALANRKVYRGESATECEECGEPIPERRRRAVPGVRLCIDCQRDAEHRRGVTWRRD